MHILVTGATGWIGSALVPQLIAAGHQVTAATRSDTAADAVRALGAEPVRANLEDPDSLRRAAEASGGVIHLAYRHDVAFTTDPAGAAETEYKAVTAMGEALAGTQRPFVVAVGLAGLAEGQVAKETDQAVAHGPASRRIEAVEHVLGLAEHGVRSSVVRLPPTVHGTGDTGFVPQLITLARETGQSAYVGAGNNRWPAVHRKDAATLFRLAAEEATAGTILHGVAEEGVAFRDIAQGIATVVGVPTRSLDADASADHFGWFARLTGGDFPTSSALTRERLGWAPSEPGLLAELAAGNHPS
ncbi:SDR family oxidoreductase [Streptomyces sp. NPDC058221]|uniref:SDR family oxidoreductase n=1 Tax=Streptomyces sp. NPDC058221 TaxID=3346388 RepID=UPI0036E369B1